MRLIQLFSIIPWIGVAIVMYFPMKYFSKGVLPKHFTPRYILFAVFGLLPIMSALSVTWEVPGKDMASDFAREQSCAEVVRETAMITSISVATGTASATIMISAITLATITPLGAVALVVVASSLAGIGGYGTGAAVGAFSSNCQAPDT